jgi:hypothetical protein
VERAWNVFLQSEGFQWSSVFTMVVNKLDMDSAAQTGGNILSWNYWPVKAVEEYLAVERICVCFFIVVRLILSVLLLMVSHVLTIMNG